MDAQHQLGGWWRSALLSIAVAGIGTFFWQARPASSSFKEFAAGFTSGYVALNADPRVLEIRDRLQEVPDDAALAGQQRFFTEQAAQLKEFDRFRLSEDENEEAQLIAYLIERHLERIELEMEWSRTGRKMPARGMNGLPQQKRWYAWLVNRYTSVAISPEEVKALGEREIARCKKEIAAIGTRPDRSVITDKQELISEFERIDSITRSRLERFTGEFDVPPVHAMEWPGADRNTPPGIYLPREYNPYNADVFQFNFHDGKFDRSALGWIYLHEAIPGHHLQFSIRRMLSLDPLQEALFEPGDHEGWACYVEYHGDVLGLYDDPLQRLGKWEWDLVRSVRLVLDVGIHFEGWSREKALEFWKANIEGKDDIAEREVDRVTAMPGQVLSYKVGADRIEQMAGRMMNEYPHLDRKAFHRAYLETGTLPLDLKEERIRMSLN